MVFINWSTRYKNPFSSSMKDLRVRAITMPGYTMYTYFSLAPLNPREYLEMREALSTCACLLQPSLPLACDQSMPWRRTFSLFDGALATRRTSSPIRAEATSGRAIVASTWTCTCFVRAYSLPQLIASSNVHPERPPKCGESDVYWIA